ncbi:MAG: hypothetical protein Unbinned2903contig1001_24 [Prokaryotic dsDNA virus sp.]|nr:MAG: hypothetical protein Unbinned2903contig1001_24 [Prokaryotic dsDNA virus sp.]|tara:strand:+ start:12724 stop:13179 length:456 start_codon:yes stop_codon:yes gene_type:complete
MIDLMDTKIGEVLNKTLILSDADAWIRSIDLNLKKNIVIDWIQRDQLFNKGVNSLNAVIGYYSPLTEILSGGRKKAGEKYNLFDTGAFYRSMFISVLANEILISADDTKMLDQKWYTKHILGLNDENLQKLIYKVKQNYIKYVRKVLGINR